jgi:diguanylate cyclase (GGDEF)-like protein
MYFTTDNSGGIETSGVHALIDNMNNLAFTDPLTGIYNRRYISEKLPVDLLNAALLSTKLSVVMADIDHFKNVNDTYGHLAGDYTLKCFAKKMTDCLKRGSDWIARFGGEEFLICLPGADIDVAKAAAETMRQAIEAQTIRYESGEIHITVSFGVYCVKPDASESVDDILRQADLRLYTAKKNGRNRVESETDPA